MAKLNYNVLTKVVSRSQKAADIAFEQAQKETKREITNLKTKFSKDSVTKELEAGPDATNISGTLGGYGNLFSFIGFSEGTDPITPIRNILNKFQLIKTRKNPIVRGKVIRYNFTLKVPTEELRLESQMPWEPGSWIANIKRGISGVGHYLYGTFKTSRSGTGIQTAKSERPRQFAKRDYLFEWINEMLERLRN